MRFDLEDVLERASLTGETIEGYKQPFTVYSYRFTVEKTVNCERLRL